MSTRTIIEINHDCISKLRNLDSYLWNRLLMDLASCNLDEHERKFFADRGIRWLAQRHHSETVKLKVE